MNMHGNCMQSHFRNRYDCTTILIQRSTQWVLINYSETSIYFNRYELPRCAQSMFPNFGEIGARVRVCVFGDVLLASNSRWQLYLKHFYEQSTKCVHWFACMIPFWVVLLTRCQKIYWTECKFNMLLIRHIKKTKETAYTVSSRPPHCHRNNNLWNRSKLMLLK